MNDILKEARSLFDYSQEIRRTIHQNPELSFEEYETSALVKRELDSFKIPWIAVGETGIVATITGRKAASGKRKVVALRADMDALTIEEEADVAFKSKIEGKMHACGHDLHTTSLLTAARLLDRHRDDFGGTVKLIFQPAEEMVRGAEMMMKENSFIKDVDCIVGMHVMPFLKTGCLGFKDDGFMFGGEYFEISVKGKAGHGSQPETAVDALLAASAIVQNSKSITSQEISALDSVVLTICTMEAGTRLNIIAENAKMTGTIRFLEEKDRKNLKASLERITKATAETFSAQGQVRWDMYVPAVQNDSKLGSCLRKIAEQLVGKDNLEELRPLTSSEDFAYFAQQVPGYFVILGCGNEGSENPPVHSGLFNPNEECLPIGAAAYAQFAIDLLEER